jgi:LAO/AO transport system kinase
MTLDPSAWVDALARGDRRTVGRALTLCEDLRPQAREARRRLFHALDAAGMPPRATVVGWTGSPGAGKSTLVDAVADRLLTDDPAARLAVVAVDPSSIVSGGSLLGDRTRLERARHHERLHYRSQPSGLEMGGLGRTTWHGVRLLRRLVDFVFVETVGAGQSETRILHLADRVVLVVAPLQGDTVQWMKGGIMEVPDALVLSKADTGRPAQVAWRSLQAAMGAVRTADAHPLPLFRVSAVQGEGLGELGAWLRSPPVGGEPSARAQRQSDEALRQWVLDEFGRDGLRRAGDRLAGWQALARGDFEAGEYAAARALGGWPANDP